MSGSYFVRLNASAPPPPRTLNTHTRRGWPHMGEVSGTSALDFYGLCPWEAERGGRPRRGCGCETGNSERPSSRCFGSGEWGVGSWGWRCRGGPGAQTAPAAVKGRGVERQRLDQGRWVLGIPSSLSNGSRSVEKMRDTEEGKERTSVGKGPAGYGRRTRGCSTLGSRRSLAGARRPPLRKPGRLPRLCLQRPPVAPSGVCGANTEH